MPVALQQVAVMSDTLQWLHLAAVAGGAMVLQLGLWLIQVRRRDASLVDAGWSGGIGCAAVMLALLGDGDPSRRLVLGGLGAAWSLRLTIYLVRDRLLGKPEDGRYRLLRQQWGTQANRNFLIFFQVQAFFIVAFSWPFWLMAADRAPFGAWHDWVGLAVWLVGFIGVAIADAQLARWRQATVNAGRTCRAGLWQVSRHPNYFFEWVLWCGYPLIAISAPWSVAAWGTPAFLLYLLLFVTGIPYNEKRNLESRGDDYRQYQRVTSAFIPWFPKSEATS